MKKLLAALALALASPVYAAGPVVLEGSTDSLELVTSAAGSIDYVVSWSNVTATALTTPGTAVGNITTATTTTLISGISASNWRYVRLVKISNISTTITNVVTLQVDRSASNRRLDSVSLAPGMSATLTDEGLLETYTASGLRRSQATDISGYTGRLYPYMKTGGAKDSAGYMYAYSKDAGLPGASVPGAPGVNGWNTDCSQATNAANPAGATQLGANVLPNPATGGWYMTQLGFSTNVAEALRLTDILWYNTGLAVAAGAQAIAAPGGLGPARDASGSTNGDGYGIGILVLTTLGNAAAIATSTATYTDSDGNAGNTATLTAVVGYQLPATAVLGTFVPMQLAAGDRGVRTITSWNTVTTYTSGTYALVLYRALGSVPAPVTNSVSKYATTPEAPGVRVWNGACIVALSYGSASAASIIGDYALMER